MRTPLHMVSALMAHLMALIRGGVFGSFFAVAARWAFYLDVASAAGRRASIAGAFAGVASSGRWRSAPDGLRAS